MAYLKPGARKFTIERISFLSYYYNLRDSRWTKINKKQSGKSTAHDDELLAFYERQITTLNKNIK
jgi:hypothetical protein